MRYYIGVNCAHDAAACVFTENGEIFAACEDRFRREKHCDGFPKRALARCLETIGISDTTKPQKVVINQDPSLECQSKINDVWPAFNRQNVIIYPSHHLLHALYCHVASGYQNAAHLVLDGSGYPYEKYVSNRTPYVGLGPNNKKACETISVFVIRDSNITEVHRTWDLWPDESNTRYRYPSLGHLYSVTAQIIFGDWVHAGKVMGLAAYGDANVWQRELVALGDDGVTVDTTWSCAEKNVINRESLDRNERAINIAARVQSELEKGVVNCARRAYAMTKESALCVSGGVALNSVANGRVIDEGIFQDVFFAPAAGDSGTAIGAAIYGYLMDTGHMPRINKYSDYLGPRYSSADVDQCVKNVAGSRVAVSYPAFPASAAAEDIVKGMTVGWFQDRSEFGPRALGNRSILADARRPDIKDILNRRVKNRESFRPFAVSVLAECGDEWFEQWCDNEFMLVVRRVRSDKLSQIPGACHVDGSCRVQSIGTGLIEYRKLIQSFYESTGVPLVINTSLNTAGEPLCETPSDALNCFLRTKLDVIYLQGVRLAKQ